MAAQGVLVGKGVRVSKEICKDRLGRDVTWEAGGSNGVGWVWLGVEWVGWQTALADIIGNICQRLAQR